MCGGSRYRPFGGSSPPPLMLLLLLLLMAVGTYATNDASSAFETVHTSNAAILNRLGLAPLQIPDGHHKKRLAGPEPPVLNSQTRIHQPYGRRHGHRDSHIYIVKLPASPPYYTITKPHKAIKDEKLAKTGVNLPVGFHGNGKPAKVYHWNLPLVKKITEKKRLQAQLRIDQSKKKLDEAQKRQQQSGSPSSSLPIKAGIDDKIQAESTDTSKKNHLADGGKQRYHTIEDRIYKNSLSKHTRNNDKRLSYPDLAEGKDSTKKSNSSGKKTYRLDDSSMHRIRLTNEIHGARSTLPKIKKHRKKAAMSYYAPIAAKPGTTSIHKNFSGNGKPKAFYVMEKSRKPVYYHPLLP